MTKPKQKHPPGKQARKKIPDKPGSPKRISFCNSIIAGDSQSEAYKAHYKCSGMIQKTIAREAMRLANLPEMAKYIAEGQAKTKEEAVLTASDLIKELQVARKMAKDLKDPSTMIKGTMGKATILGIGKQTLVLENAKDLTPWDEITDGSEDD